MSVIPWIVSLINRKWQKEFDKTVTELESAPKFKPEIPHIEDMMKVARNQPTHLAYNFMSRARRNHHNKRKGGGKYGSYAKKVY
jgi:hypothetical protein